MKQTLYEKIWNAHVVRTKNAEPTLLYIDLHLIHEVTSPQAFAGLKKRGLAVRQPNLTLATIDHSVPTRNVATLPWADKLAYKQVQELINNCQQYGIKLLELDNNQRGIVHVVGPELGLTQPGKTIVCGDSHTSTHGAFGALAFGIGTSEVEHVLATQCLLQNKTKTMAITVNGSLPKGVYAKDIILKIIQQIGIGGGNGYTFEYRGEAIEHLSMEGRLTLCNMSIEAGAKTGLIGVDETTLQYLTKYVRTNSEAEYKQFYSNWQQWTSDQDAVFDKTIELNASFIKPMVTWGTNPSMSVSIDELLPQPITTDEIKAYEYMGLKPGQPINGQTVDVVFIGSCTNSRIEDLRVAAEIMRGQQVAIGKQVLVVPGSQAVKHQAEAEGLCDIFEAAGADWREPGCSICLAMNGDNVPAGKYCASTSNRNFIGRQGKGARTFLVSPAMAALAAIKGQLADVREYL